MMDSGASLQTPRSAGGRSRFSKALPAPPPTLDTMLTPRKMPSGPLPPPPLKESAVPKPLDSPLPPLPLKDRAPPPMSIPRRPVGNRVSAGETSPVASISSLLSAYSRTSGESILKSSEGTASTKTSYIAASPEQVGLGGDFRKEEVLTPLTSLSIDVDLQKQAQDGRKPFTPGLPRSPLDSMGARSPVGLSTSQQSPQLWRRRSVRTDKNLAVSELKLTASHGSTASTQQQGAATTLSLVPPHPPFADPASDGPAQTRSPVGLPGRDIRPVASREPVAQNPEMVQPVSDFEAQMDARLHWRGKTTGGGSEQQNAADLNLPIQRLPTPDYDHHDVKSPLLETIVSPISPASSPELPSRDSAPKPPIPRRAVAERELRAAKITASLQAEQAEISTSTAPEMHEVRLLQRPRDPAATHEVAASQNHFPARTSSRAVEQPQVVLRRQPAETQPPVQPRLAKSRDSGAEVDEEHAHLDGKVAPPPLSLDTSGEDAVAHAELDSGETSPGADHPPFPVSFAVMAPPGTVFAAPPLSTKNFMCLQRHRNMFRDRNMHCPLSCQACQKQDAELRFKCKWCYLRICQSCMDILHENNRDLQRLVDHLNDPPPMADDDMQSPTAEFASSYMARPVSLAQES